MIIAGSIYAQNKFSAVKKINRLATSRTKSIMFNIIWHKEKPDTFCSLRGSWRFSLQLFYARQHQQQHQQQRARKHLFIRLFMD